MKSSLTADIPCRNEVHTTFRTLIIKTKIRIGRSVLFIEEEYGPELVNTVNVHWWYDILFEFSYWLEKNDAFCRYYFNTCQTSHVACF